MSTYSWNLASLTLGQAKYGYSRLFYIQWDRDDKLTDEGGLWYCDIGKLWKKAIYNVHYIFHPLVVQRFLSLNLLALITQSSDNALNLHQLSLKYIQTSWGSLGNV